MSVYRHAESRSRPAEDQIWERLDRMHNAGPVADCYLAAHERRAWAAGAGRSVPAGTSLAAAMLPACRRWVGTRLSELGRWLVDVAPGQVVAGDRFMTIQRRLAG
jgi:hypothetical protein